MNSKSRASLKALLGDVLWHFPTRQISRFLVAGDRGLILMFHYTGLPIIPGVSEDLFLTRQELVKTLDFVASNFCPLEPLEFLKRLSSGNLPSRATLLTFDDGTKDSVTVVMPELAKRNLKACFFVCPGLIESDRNIPSLELMTLLSQARPEKYELDFESGLISGLENGKFTIDLSDQSSLRNAYQLLWPLLLRCSSKKQPAFFQVLRESLGRLEEIDSSYPLATWKELALLEDSGMWVGNHTMFHSTATADGADQFGSDIEQAFVALESRFGIRQRIFCYPYGRTEDSTDATRSVLKALDVEYAFVTQGGLARPNSLDAWNLHREQASYSISALKLAPLLAIFR